MRGIAVAVGYWAKVHGIAFAIGGWEKDGEGRRRRRGNWRVKERIKRGLGFGRLTGERLGFGEEDGEEFDQIKVALVPVVELDVLDEFGVGGHVVVSDHAAVPPADELHPDVSSDEVVMVGEGGKGEQGWDKYGAR